MNTSQQIAKHFRDVDFGGNWTSVNFISHGRRDTDHGIKMKLHRILIGL